MTISFNNPEFDGFAADYDAALDQGLAVSGEQKEFFSRGRIAWLRKCLTILGQRPRSVLDFGCGTGSATPIFFELLKVESIRGIDPSGKSVALALQNYGSNRAHFTTTADFLPYGDIDLGFCNGVFHHIPVANRADAVQFLQRCLRSGGFFSFWENNPWNPGTRYVMSRIPFDRDAIMISSIEASRMLQAGGFQIVRIDFLFFFPRLLKAFRLIEPALSKLPLGAQYQILCRKP